MAFLRVPERSHSEPEPTDAPSRNAPPPALVVRPPGAAAPRTFAERCTGCGDCVHACPYEVIRADEAGLPYLVPAESPCLSCLDVPCASACETGALAPVAHPASIRMGTASIEPDRCVAAQGEPCTTCFDGCPFRHRAIRMQGEPVAPVISPTLCTGCGVCAYLCPTDAMGVQPSPAPFLVGGAR